MFFTEIGASKPFRPASESYYGAVESYLLPSHAKHSRVTTVKCFCLKYLCAHPFPKFPFGRNARTHSAGRPSWLDKRLPVRTPPKHRNDMASRCNTDYRPEYLVANARLAIWRASESQKSRSRAPNSARREACYSSRACVEGFSFAGGSTDILTVRLSRVGDAWWAHGSPLCAPTDVGCSAPHGLLKSENPEEVHSI